jgi:hypothetical protein
VESRTVRGLLKVAVVAALAPLAGCATSRQPVALYDWGGYQAAIYASLVKPGSVSPEQEIADMEKHASVATRKLPPGWYAHLAMLYSEVGQGEKARAALMSERAAFPESTVFVDSLVRNLSGKPAAEGQK